MIKEAIGGFCMALADSVPGVSGGTVAFIMGFYDQFIGSVHDLAFGKMEDKKKAIAYLIKLGIGWIIGMGLAVVILSALFESHIYVVSSLFIGFIAGAIPLIIREERDGFKQFGKGILFLILGIVLVAGITWLNGRAGTSSMDLSHFQLGNAIKLFFIGMIAISAMFLPGISGSTLLLIFGVYIPVISAIRAALGLQLSYVPNLIFFGLGIVAGACCKDYQGLPGALPPPDAVLHRRHDGGLLLCNRDGTDNAGRSAGSAGFLQLSLDCRHHRTGAGAWYAVCKRKRKESLRNRKTPSTESRRIRKW